MALYEFAIASSVEAKPSCSNNLVILGRVSVMCLAHKFILDQIKHNMFIFKLKYKKLNSYYFLRQNDYYIS